MTNEEIAGRIMVRALRMTWEEQDTLHDVWVSIPWRDRDAAVIGAVVSGNADDGAFDGAFTLDVGDVSSSASISIGAALAVLARDSRSESGPFTFDHYDILTRAWRQVIGAVHPDDALPTGDDVGAAQEDMR